MIRPRAAGGVGLLEGQASAIRIDGRGRCQSWRQPAGEAGSRPDPPSPLRAEGRGRPTTHRSRPCRRRPCPAACGDGGGRAVPLLFPSGAQSAHRGAGRRRPLSRNRDGPRREEWAGCVRGRLRSSPHALVLEESGPFYRGEWIKTGQGWPRHAWPALVPCRVQARSVSSECALGPSPRATARRTKGRFPCMPGSGRCVAPCSSPSDCPSRRSSSRSPRPGTRRSMDPNGSRSWTLSTRRRSSIAKRDWSGNVRLSPAVAPGRSSMTNASRASPAAASDGALPPSRKSSA